VGLCVTESVVDLWVIGGPRVAAGPSERGLRAGARADEGEWSSNSGAQRPTSWLARAEEAETDQNGETGERERTRVPLIRVSWPARRLEVRGGRLLRQSIYFLRRGAHGRARCT